MNSRIALPANGANAGPSQESELARVLEAYLAAVEAGQAIDPEALAAQHPEIADRLTACLSVLRVASQVEARADADVAVEVLTESRLGDFRIIRMIGRGGMGIVFEAEQVSLRRRVALKVLPFAAALDPQQLHRFQIEAQAAAQLHHTNIVPIFSVGCEQGVHYYAMQHIEGQTLAALIQDLRRLAGLEHSSSAVQTTAAGVSLAEEVVSGRLAPPPAASPRPVGGRVAEDRVRRTRGRRTSLDPTCTHAYFRTVAELGLQAAEALDYAHRLGIIHRDIKPANLLVDVRGNLWVTDFGMARMQADTGMTMTGDILGTLRYMSPEQSAARRGIVDHRTDVYSLGATLYELLTLEPARQGNDRAEVLHQMTFGEPKLPRTLNPSIPRDLETIVLKATSREVENRYAMALELADDLRRFLEHKPVQARRPTLWEKGLKWQRRHPSIVVSVAVLLVLAIVGLAISTALVARERALTENALTEARRLNQVALASAAKAKVQRQHAEINLVKALDVMNRLLTFTDPNDSSRKVLDHEALRYYQGFLDRIQGDPDANLERGHVYLYMSGIYLQGEKIPTFVELCRKAIGCYTARVVQEPEDSYGWTQLGQGNNILGLELYDRGQRPRAVVCFNDAAKAYEQAAGLDPTDPKALMYLAWFLASCPDARYRDPPRAIELSREALKSAPESGSIWNALGVASYRAGHWADCIAALEKSVEFSGGGEGIDWFFLAMAHARLGDPATAKPWYDKAAQWVERNNPRNGELRRFRAEAAVLLGLKHDPPIPRPDHEEGSRPSPE